MSWEERQAERAAERQAAIWRAERAEAAAAKTAALEAMPDRWIEHVLDEHGRPVDETGKWPDHHACTQCWEHDGEGRLREVAKEHWYWGTFGYEPVQICGHEWVTLYDEGGGYTGFGHSGCTCFCHLLEVVVVIS